MNKLLLSIIIPVYNTQDYVRECLDSLVKQDLSFCEVICVDDGSIDNSLKILREYQSQYPDIIKVFTQSNQGQAVARNVAIDNAVGDYIAFLDSDDYYLPHAIATIKEFIRKNYDIDVFYWDAAIMTNGDRYYILSLDKPIMQSTTDYYDWQFKQYNTTPVGCVCGGVYRRKYLNKFHLRMLSGVYYEDALFVFSIFICRASILAMHLDQPFYYYRLGREGSTITLLREKNFKDRIIVAREMNRLLQQSKCITISRKHTIFGMYLDNIVEGYLNGFIDVVSKLMTKDDIKIMENGAVSNHEKKLIRLLRFNFRLMAAYKTNSLPSIVRRFINRFVV